jgi:transposase
VGRVKAIWQLCSGEKVSSIGKKFDQTRVTISKGLERSNELGLESLADRARSGWPATNTEE